MSNFFSSFWKPSDNTYSTFGDKAELSADTTFVAQDRLPVSRVSTGQLQSSLPCRRVTTAGEKNRYVAYLVLATFTFSS